MPQTSSKLAKCFTVDEANAMLPLVRAIAGDMVMLSREVAERRQRLNRLRAGREISPGDPYSDEVCQIEQELEKDLMRLDGYVDELNQLGLEMESSARGLIDFPANMDGRSVYLCWQYNEPEILYWHDLHAGFARRQPMTAAAASGEVSDDSHAHQDPRL